MSEMIAFPSIESLRQVVTGTKMRCEFDKVPLPVVDYVGTVKLHGSNAGIILKENGEIIPQSRNRVLSVGDDNFGFAAFVEKNRELLEVLLNELCMDGFDYTLYGEWCGGNIQPKVALENLDKHFVIFTVYSHYAQRMFPSYTLDNNGFKIDYARLNAAGIYFIHQIPTYTVTVDFNNPEACVDQLSDLTIAVEKECPWGKFRVQKDFNNTCTINNGNISWDNEIADCKLKDEIESKIIQYVQANNLLSKRITISV